MNLVGDFGTSWTKLINIETGERQVIKTASAKNFNGAAPPGHNAKRFSKNPVGELVALARGGMKLLGESFAVLDVGSRDMKYVQMKKGDLKEMDWNSQCGALTGFTVQLLAGHFGIDFHKVEPANKPLPITCGVLGMEKVFDEIARGTDTADAIAMFV